MPEPALPYETSAPNSYEWTEKAFDGLVSGVMSASVIKKEGIQTAYVSGPCPRCKHEVHFEEVLDGVTGERVATLGAEEMHAAIVYVPLTASCRCTEPHEHRPEKIEHGCGINFRVDVQADNS